MKKFKKIISLGLATMAAVSAMSFNVFAAEMEIHSETDDAKIEWLTENNNAFSDTVVFPVVELSDNIAEDEKQEIIEKTLDDIKNNNNLNTMASIGVAQGTAIFRKGNSTSCELYISWTGTEFVSMFSFSNFKVQSTRLISPTIYSNIGGSTVKCEYAATSGYAKVLDINIPTNVETVRAVVTNPACCTLSEGWIYGTALNQSVTIN